MSRELDRLLIIDDIKNGNFESLYMKAMNVLPLSIAEIQSIIKAWRRSNNEALLFFYYISIFNNNLEEIKRSDQYYKEYLQNNETMKRG